jgi:hypothetical protein
MESPVASLIAFPVPSEAKGGSGNHPRHPGALNRRDFFAAIAKSLREILPEELAGFRIRANSMLLKIDYGNERVHFEVWPDAARGHVEIGLHFEDGPASTHAYLTFFDSRIVEIKHLLGDQIELERWTVSWGHLFETHARTALTRDFAEFVTKRLASQIRLLQPMVQEAAVPVGRRDESAVARGRWPRRQGR